MFKIGDVVIGNKKANKYGITVEGYIGTVVLVSGNEIEIRGDDGQKFLVDAECFYLYTDSKEYKKFEQSNMSVLLRDTYRWTKAVFDTKSNRIIVQRVGSVDPWNIVDIKNDERLQYVWCKNCGTILLNTDAAKNEHTNMHKQIDVCLGCRYFKKDSRINKSSKITINEEGKYILSTSDEYNCYCGIEYGWTEIGRAKESSCKYLHCNTFDTLDDFHVRYPHAFNKIATVDALDSKKWKIDPDKHNAEYYAFKATKRYTLLAQVNKMGIIDCFVYKCYDTTKIFVYSEKYNKLFWKADFDDISDTCPTTSIDEARYNELLEVVSNIYKGD